MNFARPSALFFLCLLWGVLGVTTSGAPIPSRLSTAEDIPLLNVPVDFSAIPDSVRTLAIEVRTTSTNALLLPSTSVVLQGTGPHQSMSLYPGANQNGFVTLSLIAHDPRNSNSFTNQFTVTVTPVNDPPEFEGMLPVRWFEGAALPAIPFAVRDVDGDPISTRIQIDRGAGLTPETTLVLLPPVDRFVHRYEVRFQNAAVPAGNYRYRLSASDGKSTNLTTLNLIVEPRLLLSTAPGILVPSEFAIDFADLSADGFPELVLSPGALNSPQILANNQGHLGVQVLFSKGSMLPNQAWDDFDGDGRLEAASLQPGNGNGLLKLWRTGTSQSPAPPILLASSNVLQAIPTQGTQLISADFDGDGDRDILMAIPSQPTPGTDPGTWLARNRGDGTFLLENVGPAIPSAVVAVGDLNDDGVPDLASVALDASGLGRVVLWINDGTGRFVRETAPIVADNYVSIGLADFDGDGRLDLWLVSRPGPKESTNRPVRTSVLLHTAAGWSESWSTETAAAIPGSLTVAVADFDGDGMPDLIGPGTSDGLSGWFLFSNQGNGRFEAVTFVTSSQSAPHLAVGDINGDGRPDLAYGAINSDAVRGQILTNGIPRLTLPPAVPTHLRSRLDGTRLQLEWDAGPDSFSSTPPTFNVRLGTTPGANDVVPSLSRPDGLRLMFRPGNAGFRHALSVNLAGREGTNLFWSVQAMDAGGRASAFATEQTLSVRLAAAPPVISGLGNFSVNEDSTARIEFQITDDQTPASDLQVQVEPATSDLLTSWKLAPSSNAVRVLTVVPKPNVNGPVVFAVKATDRGGNTTSQQFTLTILPVNDPPQWGPVTEQRGIAGEAMPPIRIRVSDLESPISALQFSATSSEESVLPAHAIQFRSFDETAIEVSATGPLLKPGSTVLTLTVTDPEGLSSTVAVPLSSEIGALPRLASFAAPAGLTDLRVADADGDGICEIAGLADGKVLVWTASTPATWHAASLPLPDHFTATAIRWTDWNHDGRLDLLCAGIIPQGKDAPRSTVVVLLNQANGWAIGPVLNPFPVGYQFVELTDLTDDGAEDLVAAGLAVDGTPRLYLAPRAGGTYGVQAIDVSASGDVHAVDVDRDGRTDLVAGGHPLQWFTQTGRNWVARGDSLGDSNGSEWLDLDHDGRWDAITGVASAPNSAWVFSDLASRPFPPRAVPFGVGPATTLVDLNADGFIDAVHVDDSGRPVLQTGSGLSWNPPQRLHPDLVFLARGGVVDESRRTGLVLAVRPQDGFNTNEATIVVLGPIPVDHLIVPPAAPSGVTVAFESDGVFIEWSRTSEDLDRGVTYNLRVGNAANGDDIVPAYSTADGVRRIAGAGNAGLSLRRRITGLTTGKTYHVSVQSVDASGLGGAFSIDVPFVIPAHTLTLLTSGLVTTNAAGDTATLAFEVHGSQGALTFSAVLSPAFMGTASTPFTNSAGERVTEVHFNPGVSGTARLTLRVEDATHTRTSLQLAIPHGTPPAGADFGLTQSLRTAREMPLPVNLRRLGGIAGSGLDRIEFPTHGVLNTEFPDAYYTPAAGFEGPDAFAYWIRLADGSRLLAEFTLLVQGTPETRLYIRPDGRIDAAWSTTPGETGILQRSTDLIQWTTIDRYAAPAGGTVFLLGIGYRDDPGTHFLRLKSDK